MTLKHNFMTPSTYIQGKYAEAEPLNARATEILEKALRPEHPLVATALNNRAVVEQLFLRIVPFYVLTLAHTHPVVLPHCRANTTRRNRCTIELSLSARKQWVQSIQSLPCGSTTARGC
ncbi:unnamed protein product [Ectocarpus sp. 12 AP-2014]